MNEDIAGLELIQTNAERRRKLFDLVGTVVLILVTLVFLLTPSLLIFKKLVPYTIHVMLGMLVLGFLAFLFDRQRLMMTSLMCCGALCLFLKASSNQQMRYAATREGPTMRITHINLGNADSEYEDVIDYILGLETDIFSFQELTPDWETVLRDRLQAGFPHIQTLTSLDQYGTGFFSRVPIADLDTIYFKEIPVLSAAIPVAGDMACHVISCQMVPPVNRAAFQFIDQHLQQLAQYLSDLEGGVIVCGDFHLPPWATEVQKFKTVGQLQDCRRDIQPRNLDGSVSLPRIPVDHILYSPELECTAFLEIGSPAVGRLGITGTYQFQSRFSNSEQ